jgi:hypothetical protein
MSSKKKRKMVGPWNEKSVTESSRSSESGSVWDENESDSGSSSRGSSVYESSVGSIASSGGGRKSSVSSAGGSIVKNPQKTTIWHAIYAPEMARLKKLNKGWTNAQMTKKATNLYHEKVAEQREKLDNEVRGELKSKNLTEKQINAEVNERYKKWAQAKADDYRKEHEELIKSGAIKLRVNTNSGRKRSSKRRYHVRKEEPFKRPDITESLVEKAAVAAEMAGGIYGGFQNDNDDVEDSAHGFLLFASNNASKSKEKLKKLWLQYPRKQQQQFKDRANHIYNLYKQYIKTSSC